MTIYTNLVPTFHQYLLLTDEPLLVHTGSVQQAEALIPKLKDILKDKILKYIFISHFESDECRALSRSQANLFRGYGKTIKWIWDYE